MQACKPKIYVSSLFILIEVFPRQKNTFRAKKSPSAEKSAAGGQPPVLEPECKRMTVMLRYSKYRPRTKCWQIEGRWRSPCLTGRGEARDSTAWKTPGQLHRGLLSDHASKLVELANIIRTTGSLSCRRNKPGGEIRSGESWPKFWSWNKYFNARKACLALIPAYIL